MKRFKFGTMTNLFPKLSMILASIATIGLIAVAAPPALATFPGENGQIAYTSGPSTNVSRAVFLTGSGQLTFPVPLTEYDYSPVWSPDGSKVAFVRFQNSVGPLGRYVIMVINKDGTGLQQVISSDALNPQYPEIHGLAWTADGQRISFYVSEAYIPYLCDTGIWWVNLDGSGLHQILSYCGGVDIVSGSYNGVNWSSEPNWSVDNKLVYVCNFRFDSNGVSKDDLCVLVPGISLTQLPIELPNGNRAYIFHQKMSPKWSPDGKKIVFALAGAFLRNNHYVSGGEIFSINPDGTGMTQLTSSPVLCGNRGAIDYTNVAPSPDGKSIVAFGTEYREVITVPCPYPLCCSGEFNEAGLWTFSANGGPGSLLVADPNALYPDWQPVPASLTFDINDGHDNPLKGLKVELCTLPGCPPAGKLLYDNPINTVGGKYVFANVNVAPGDYMLRATLVDHAGGAGSLPAFDIRYAPTPSEPVWIESKFSVNSSTESFIIPFSVNNSPLLAKWGPDLLEPGDGLFVLDSMANIYFRVRQFVDWVKTHLTLNTGQTVAFYTFAKADPWTGSAVMPTDAYYTNNAVVFGTVESEYENRDGVLDGGHPDDAPVNCEWHEFTHHLYDTFISSTTCPDGVDHGGYSNPDTCYSMVEGFAEFLPVLAWQDINFASNPFYDNIGIDLDLNIKAWGYRGGGENLEEFAVAALFWDLVSGYPHNEITQVIGQDGLHHPVTYTNQVNLSLRQLWDQLTTSRPMMTVSDFRNSFNIHATVDLDGDGIADVAPIDEVFLMHGFFPVDTDQTITATHKTYHYDVNYAQRRDPTALRNGAVGESGHHGFAAFGTPDRIPRYKTPQVPHANLEIHVLDGSGTPVSGATINMTIRYPGFEETVSRRLSSGDGALVHLELPPYFDYLLPTGAPLPDCDPANDYHVEVSVSATVNGTPSSNSASFDNCTYMRAVDAATGPAALSLTLTVPVTSTNLPPVALCQNITVNAGLTCTANASINNGSYDPDAGDSITLSQSPAGPYPKGDTSVTLTVKDSKGASSQCTGKVTVSDNTPPSITAPAGVTAYTGPGATSCGTVVNDGVLGTATASDNCPGVTVSRTGVPTGNLFPVGTTTVTYTAKDASGNVAQATQTVTVIDNTQPTLNLPADVTVPTDPGQCSAVVNYTVTAADNCTGVTLTSNPQSGSTFQKGTTTVNATATDAARNTATGSFKVTVLDKETPTITNVSATPSVLWPPNHKMVNVTINYSATDNCDQPVCKISSVTSNEPISSSDYTVVDAHHVQLTADRLGSGNGRIYTIAIICTDASGNSSSQSVMVTVPHDQGK